MKISTILIFSIGMTIGAGMSAHEQYPEGHPIQGAWEDFVKTEEYETAREFTQDVHFIDGALWFAFEAGYRAGKSDGH